MSIETPAVESVATPTPETSTVSASTKTTQSAASTPTAAVTKSTAAAAESNDTTSDWLSSLDTAISSGVASEKTSEVKDVEINDDTEVDVKADADSESVEDSEELPAMTKAAGAKFKQLKSDLKTWKQKAAELEKQIAERPQQVPEDYEQLRSRVDEYEKEISVSRVESSPQFKQAVVEPLNSVLSAAYSMASRYKVPENAMEVMLQEQDVDKQNELLQEVVSGFSERDRLNLYRLVDDIGVILTRRDEILNNASEAHKTLVASEKERTTTEHKQAMDSVWKVLSDKVPLFSDKTVANDVKSKALSTNLLEARPDVRAYAAYSGAVLPHLLKQNQSLTTKVAELEKALTGIRKTVPKAGQGRSQQAETPKEMSFLDALEAQL